MVCGLWFVVCGLCFVVCDLWFGDSSLRFAVYDLTFGHCFPCAAMRVAPPPLPLENNRTPHAGTEERAVRCVVAVLHHHHHHHLQHHRRRASLAPHLVRPFVATPQVTSNAKPQTPDLKPQTRTITFCTSVLLPCRQQRGWSCARTLMRNCDVLRVICDV